MGGRGNLFTPPLSSAQHISAADAMSTEMYATHIAWHCCKHFQVSLILLCVRWIKKRVRQHISVDLFDEQDVDVPEFTVHRKASATDIFAVALTIMLTVAREPGK